MVAVLYLITADADTGTYLYKSRTVIDGFSVSGNRIEDCRVVGVRTAKKLSEYYRQWYPNASTNVDCTWERKQ